MFIAYKEQFGVNWSVYSRFKTAVWLDLEKDGLTCSAAWPKTYKKEELLMYGSMFILHMLHYDW